MMFQACAASIISPQRFKKRRTVFAKCCRKILRTLGLNACFQKFSAISEDILHDSTGEFRRESIA